MYFIRSGAFVSFRRDFPIRKHSKIRADRSQVRLPENFRVRGTLFSAIFPKTVASEHRFRNATRVRFNSVRVNIYVYTFEPCLLAKKKKVNREQKTQIHSKQNTFIASLRIFKKKTEICLRKFEYFVIGKCIRVIRKKEKGNERRALWYERITWWSYVVLLLF